MKKRILSFLLAAVMILLLIPVIAVPASATSSQINIIAGSFECYKGWMDADAGNQTRYKQRSYSQLLRDSNPITYAFDGNNATWSSCPSVTSYFPELYLNASGELVRDKTWDDVNEDVDFDDYAANGLGKYYGVFKFTLESRVALDTVTIYAGPDGSAVDSNKAFDILYSVDGVHWTVLSSYTNMQNGSNWTTWNGSLATLNVSCGDAEARYIAFAVSAKSGKETGGLWLFEISATGTVAPSAISIASGTFTGYKTFLKANDGQDRYKQRNNAITLSGDHPITHAFDGSHTTYAGGTGGVGGYYPSLYLNASGELVKDTQYDNVNTSVSISTYRESGLGKYYGFFKFELSEAADLETITIKAPNDGSLVDSDHSFDILYSIDGKHWTVAKSYTDNMSDGSNWTTWDGSLGTLVVPMGGVDAKYVAYAVSAAYVQETWSLYLFEIAVEGHDLAPATYEVGTEEEMIRAMEAHNNRKNRDDVILVTDDITFSSAWKSRIYDTDLGYIYGTFNGQNHTFYNVTTGSFLWPNGNCLLENFTVSNKTAPGGGTFTMSGLANFCAGESTASDIPAGTTAIIRNIVNQRVLTSSSNATGGFFGKINIAGTIRIENCTNEGNYTGTTSRNDKIGGFVGSFGTGTLIIENCTNSGNISASQAGGFIGVYSVTNGTSLTIRNSINTGAITGFANGTAYGMAGGFVGSANNADNATVTTTVTITGCTNTGNITVNYTADSSKDCAAGGIIGHAGGVALDDATAYTVTIDNCAVRNCTIDAMGDDQTYGQTDSTKEYAGSFIGKVSPRGTNYSIVAKASYVSNVNIRADHARRFLGVGTYNTDIAPQAINLIAINLNEADENGDIVDWNSGSNSNCKRLFNTTDTFTQTDGNKITGGTAGFMQTNHATSPSKVRFASSLDAENIGNLARVGYIITTAYTEGGVAKVTGWVKTTTVVYEYLHANTQPGEAPVTYTASQLYTGSDDDWIFALTVEDIPSGIGDVDFMVTPFIVQNDGTILFGRTGSTEVTVGTISDTPIKIMSYNIKDGDYLNQSASQRATGLAKKIALKNPEIVCVQEAKTLSASSLASYCKSNGTRTYTVYQASGATTAVMWDATLYTKITSGTFDVTVPEASGGDGYTRIETWVKFSRVEDGEIFYVISAHFDLNKPGTSAAALIDYVNENFYGSPVIVMGDLNANEARWVNIVQMKRDGGFANANTAYTDFLTEHNIKGYAPYAWTTEMGSAADNGLTATFPKTGIIVDWCYYTDALFTSDNYQVVTATVTWGSKTDNPSDHYPIYAEITFK